MTRSSLLHALVTTSLLLAACASNIPEPQPPVDVPPADPDPLGVRVETLPNGLTIYLSENHEEPRVSAWIGIRAGGAQDPRDATGMAHYLEHMLAGKGTQHMGTLDFAAEAPHLEEIRALYDQLFQVEGEEERAAIYARIDQASQEANALAVANEVRQAYELIGGRGHNAFTNNDQTTYVVDVPANKLAVWATIEGDRFSNPVFRGFHTEVEAVYEEKNRALDNAGRRTYAALSELLWGDHPYGVEVLGTIEHLKRPSISKMEAFFDTWYVPSNMAVVLAGDFDSDEALALITEHFGSLPTVPAPDTRPRPVPPLTEVVRKEIVHQGDEQVLLAWQTVPYGHPDHAALQVADMVLNNQATGLLDRNLNQAQLVWRSGSRPDFMREGGSQEVWGLPKAGQSLEDLEALLLGQVQQLKAGAFDEADLAAIVLDFEISEKRQLENNFSRVDNMMDAFVMAQPWDEYRHHLDRLRAVTKADIVRVANTYLGDAYAAVYRRQGTPEIPDIKAPKLTSLQLNTADHSPFFTQVVSMETPPIEPQNLVEGEDYQVEDTPGGLLYVTPNPYNDLFQINWRYRTGDGHRHGLCDALNLWDISGAGEQDESAFKQSLYELGLTVDSYCNRWQAGIVLSGPGVNLDEGVALVERRLADPNLPQEVMDRYFEDLVSKRKDHKTTQGLQAAALQHYGMYGDDSYFLKVPLTEEEIAALTLDEMRAMPSSLLPLRRTVVYSGPHSPQEVAALVSPEDRAWADVPPTPADRYLATDGPRILFLNHESVQANIHLSIPSQTLDPARMAMVELYNEYIGGASGLVFQQIRESRALAYSAGGGYAEGEVIGDQDRVWGDLGTQADKSAQAIQVLVDIIGAPPGLPARWEAAQGAAIEGLRAHRIPFRSVGYYADFWRLKGIERDPRPATIEAMTSVDLDTFLSFAKEVGQGPYTLMVVGDQDRVDLEALGAIAPVTTFELEQLLRY